MAKTITKKLIKPLGQRPGQKQAKVSYPVEREDLDQQQERLRKAAAAGAAALRTPTPAEQTPAPATVPPKPLTPLAALWPDPVQSKGGSKPSQAPAPQVQSAPATATPPKPAGAKAVPSLQPPIQPVPLKSPEVAVVAAPAAKPTAPKTVSVSFTFHTPNAKRVSLCGEFNGWSPGATPMKRHDDGHWETTVRLAPGRYQYKFVVDEEWIADPAAQNSVPNEHGSLNSVVEVRA